MQEISTLNRSAQLIRFACRPQPETNHSESAYTCAFMTDTALHTENFSQQYIPLQGMTEARAQHILSSLRRDFPNGKRTHAAMMAAGHPAAPIAVAPPVVIVPAPVAAVAPAPAISVSSGAMHMMDIEATGDGHLCSCSAHMMHMHLFVTHEGVW